MSSRGAIDTLYPRRGPSVRQQREPHGADALRHERCGRAQYEEGLSRILLGRAVGEKRDRSRECLRTNPEATLNVIPPEMAYAAYTLGVASGRDRDKLPELEIELGSSSTVSIPGLADVVAIYEVRIAGSVRWDPWTSCCSGSWRSARGLASRRRTG